MGFISSEVIKLKGTFGDGEVRLCRCEPAAANGVNVVLLHGVHSSANLSRHNKFRHLADVLADSGFASWLVETSRRVRDKHVYGSDMAAWIRDAFSGKTFPQEQEDAFAGIREVFRRVKKQRVWLWGFSLGGIIALSAAAVLPAVEKIILSGTGLVSFPNVEKYIPTTPILSTLRSTLSPDTIQRVKANGLISFRGSKDEVFPESSCRELFNAIPLPPEAKHFFVVEGSDHSMRMRDSKACPQIMDEMVSCIVKTWL